MRLSGKGANNVRFSELEEATEPCGRRAACGCCGTLLACFGAGAGGAPDHTAAMVRVRQVPSHHLDRPAADLVKLQPSRAGGLGHPDPAVEWNELVPVRQAIPRLVDVQLLRAERHLMGQ